jgi:hypothetical protein
MKCSLGNYLQASAAHLFNPSPWLGWKTLAAIEPLSLISLNMLLLTIRASIEGTNLFQKSVAELPRGITNRLRHGPVRDPSFHIYRIVQLIRLDTYPIVQVPRCLCYDST